MSYPVFSSGDVLNASDMNAVGLWRVTGCTVSSVGGTAATASNGVITVGTGNTSVTVSNAFSTSFNSYKVVYTGGVGSTQIDMFLTLGATATGYKWSAVYTPYNATPTGAGTNVGTYFGFAASADTAWAHGQFELHNPFGSARTFFNAQNVNFAAGLNSVGFLDNNTSYTAFTLTCSGGNITGGTIRVYGYNK